MVFLCCSAGELVKTFELSSEEVQLRYTTDSLRAEVTCARFNHNGKILASCSVDGGICLDVASSGELLSRFFAPTNSSGQRRLNSVHFSSGSRFLAAAGHDGCVKIWDLKTQEVTQTYNISASAVTSVSFCGHKDEHIVAGAESGAISICDVRSGNLAGLLAADPKHGVYKVVAIQNSPHPYARYTLGATYGDGSVRVWDLNSGQLTCEFVRHHDAAATSLAISPTSKVLLATGGLDGRVCFFDTVQGKELRALEFDHPVSALALCGDGKTLAVGTTSGEILIYDLRGVITPLYSTRAHENAGVNSLQFDMSSVETSVASVHPQDNHVSPPEQQQQHGFSTGASHPPPSPGKSSGETLQQIATRKLEALGMGSAFASPPQSPTATDHLEPSSTRQSFVSSQLQTNEHSPSHSEHTAASSKTTSQLAADEHDVQSVSPEPSLLSLFPPSQQRSSPASPFGTAVSEPPERFASPISPINSGNTVNRQRGRQNREVHDIRDRIQLLRHDIEAQHRTTFERMTEVFEDLLCSYEALLLENTKLRLENDTLRASRGRRLSG